MKLLTNLPIALTSISLIAGTSFAQTASQATPKTATLYENVRVFNGTADKLTPPTNVLVVDNLIRTISSKPIEIPQGVTATHIAGDGRTLMPGLIDAHDHIWVGVPQAVVFDPKTTHEMLHEKAKGSAKATLMAGITTIRDMCGPVFGLKNEIDQGKVIGPRIYPSGTIITQTSGHGDFSAPEALPRSFGGGNYPS